tara:strand:- start:2684 stop:2911 length:228 start_codon:yes stop_codon:yes gene_type:complete
MKQIDMTPTWSAIAQILSAVLRNPDADPSAVHKAAEYFVWMGTVCDTLNETFKEGKAIDSWDSIPLNPDNRTKVE